MARTMLLEVVTPDRKVFSEQVEFFALRGAAGELGILPGHIPLFTTLAPGELRYTAAGGRKGSLMLHAGFLNVQAEKATVLADGADEGKDGAAVRPQ